MADAGSKGYSGLMFLYQHVTDRVIVQWTGQGIDQKAKADTESLILKIVNGMRSLL